MADCARGGGPGLANSHMTNSGENVRPTLATSEELAGMVDYAALAANFSEEEVAHAGEVARNYRVGRLTVRPADLDLVTRWMQGSGIQIGTTAGYPDGAETTSAKLFAVRDALQRGATSIETVLNTGKVISRQFRYVESELQQMAQECHRAGAELIVDFELGWLAEDLRVIACRIAKRVEVDWVRAGSLRGPDLYSIEELQFLTSKLGDLVKVDAGMSVRTLGDAIRLYGMGVKRFQSSNAEVLLDAWTFELQRRQTGIAGQSPITAE
jgi:deoxyribose-phosphate aldolase